MRMLSLVAVFAAFATTALGVDWSTAERVSDGIELVRLSYEQPRLMKAQAMRIDLSDKTLGFTANGRDERWGKPMPYYTNLTIRTRRVTPSRLARIRSSRSAVEASLTTSTPGARYGSSQITVSPSSEYDAS